MRKSQKTPETITTIGIDLGKNTFHLVGLDKRGAIAWTCATVALKRKIAQFVVSADVAGGLEQLVRGTHVDITLTIEREVLA